MTRGDGNAVPQSVDDALAWVAAHTQPGGIVPVDVQTLAAAVQAAGVLAAEVERLRWEAVLHRQARDSWEAQCKTMRRQFAELRAELGETTNPQHQETKR